MDGNGRICRLLANHVLGMIFPFPVPICAAAVGPEEPSRMNFKMNLVVECPVLMPQPFVQSVAVSDLRVLYLVLLEACRHRPVARDQPIELCALLVESGWYRWRQALQSVPAELRLPYDLIGKLVVYVPPVRLVEGTHVAHPTLEESVYIGYRTLTTNCDTVHGARQTGAKRRNRRCDE